MLRMIRNWYYHNKIKQFCNRNEIRILEQTHEGISYVYGFVRIRFETKFKDLILEYDIGFRDRIPLEDVYYQLKRCYNIYKKHSL